MLSLRCQTTLWWCRLPSYYYSLPKWFTHNNVIHACFIRYFPWPWSLNNHFATRIYAAESEVKLIWPRCTVRTIVHSCQRLRWFYKPLVSRGLTFDVACLLQWQTKLALKPLHIKNSLVKGIYIEKNASKLQSSFVDHTYGCSVKVSNSVFSANTVFLIQFGVGFFCFLLLSLTLGSDLKASQTSIPDPTLLENCSLLCCSLRDIFGKENWKKTPLNLDPFKNSCPIQRHW